MSVTVDLKPMPGYLHATVSGDYASEDFNGAIKRVFDAAHEHRRTKILVDCRGMKGEPTFAERFTLGQFLAGLLLEALAEGRSVGYWMAAVATPPFSHPERTGIKPLVDRGVKITICERVEDALSWLEIS